MSFYAKIHICAAVTWEDVQQQCSVKIPTVSHPFLYFMSAPQPKTYTSCKLNIQDFVSRVLLGILDTVLDHLHGVRCQNMRSEQTVEYLSALLCVCVCLCSVCWYLFIFCPAIVKPLTCKSDCMHCPTQHASSTHRGYVWTMHLSWHLSWVTNKQQTSHSFD